ncbi:MAG: 3-dehydro-L-gulonate 2-dehydrogenase [Bacteroidales bacterium]|nr:3-dehydro-L-gulonate 2-dehydrogenase [Bacteroidales bacterium]
MIIRFRTLLDTFKTILIQNGFPGSQASELSRVFAETTMDGVFSHGINRFPRFIEDVKKGTVYPGTTPALIHNHHALEQWDGQQGAGISNALFCTDRSMELATLQGIGAVGLRNTNHWMRGGSYGWRAAEKGFLFLGWTNTMPNMPPWGASSPRLGNNPFILAIPKRRGPVVLDMAMSQYSYGKLEWHKRSGTELPEYGGYNLQNRLTKDPGELLESKHLLPAGLWKGSALALVLDLSAAIISGGNTTQQIGELSSETSLSQVFISIDTRRFMAEEQQELLIKETLEYIKARQEQLRYPGQRALEDRKKNMAQGVDIPDELWKQIMAL